MSSSGKRAPEAADSHGVESSTTNSLESSSPPTKDDATQNSSLVSSLLASNPYFNAGFGLMVIGTVLTLGRRSVIFAAGAAQRRLLVSLEIPSKDRAHPWFLHWMGAQAKAQAMRDTGLLGGRQKENLRQFMGVSHRISATPGTTTTDSGIPSSDTDPDDPLVAKGSRASPIRIFSHELSVETSYQQQQANKNQQEDKAKANFSLVPGPGTHWFRYRGCWMRLQRERNSKMVDLNTGAPWETVTLTTLRSHSHLFTSLLAEARKLAMASTEGKTIIYTAWGAEWRPFGQPRRARTLGSVVLKKGKRDAIETDVKRFMERGWWYAQRGIPYRRGYLLHGSPGSGKSSFIYALAGQLDLSICLLNLSERGLTDDKLNFLLSNAPERSILLLEDVDAAFRGRQGAPEADGYQSNVTFSGLLNALDGVASGESRIIFMTTNHVERLDPALIRPGRVDVIEELGDAERDQVEDLLVRFYRKDRDSTNAEERDVVVATTQEGATTSQGEFDPQWETNIRSLASELADAVEVEAKRRRRSIGLDESGRIPLAVADSPQKDRELAKSSKVRPLPAARGGVSMAELQGLFIRFPDDPQAAVKAFQEESKGANL